MEGPPADRGSTCGVSDVSSHPRPAGGGAGRLRASGPHGSLGPPTPPLGGLSSGFWEAAPETSSLAGGSSFSFNVPVAQCGCPLCWPGALPGVARSLEATGAWEGWEGPPQAR